MDLIPGNAQHIGSREVQQDRFAFSDLHDEAFRRHGGLVAVVADGMGGLEHGDAASQAAVTSFLDAYQRKTESEPIPDALLRSLGEANKAVQQLAQKAGVPDDVGTTLVAVVGHRENLYWIAVGDSHILLARDGELTLLNQEHVFGRVLQQRVDAGEISAEEAGRHPERGSLTSYLGIDKLEEVDRSLRPFPLRPGDRILLASDGLSKTLEPDEILSNLGGAAHEVAARLVQAALAKKLPEQDNVTVIALDVVDEAPATAGPPREDPPPTRRFWKLALIGFVVIIAAGASWWTWDRWLCCRSVSPAECCGAPEETDPGSGGSAAPAAPVQVASPDAPPPEPVAAPPPATDTPAVPPEVEASP